MTAEDYRKASRLIHAMTQDEIARLVTYDRTCRILLEMRKAVWTAFNSGYINLEDLEAVKDFPSRAAAK